MPKRSRGKEFEDSLFVAFMFLGIGVGLLLGEVAPGLFIGMGLGFLAMALAELLIKKQVPSEELADIEEAPEDDKTIGAFGTFLLILLGLGFILGGSSLLLGFEIPWKVLGSVFMVMLGLFFLSIALSRLKFLKRALY